MALHVVADEEWRINVADDDEWRFGADAGDDDDDEWCEAGHYACRPRYIPMRPVGM